MESVKIKKNQQSKLKFLLAIVGLISSLVVGFQLIWDSSSGGTNTDLKLVVGIITIIFWIAFGSWAINNYIKKLQFGIIVNDEGILNNSDEIENIFVSWEKVDEIKLLGDQKQSKIGILIKELPKYESSIKRKNQIKQIQKNIKVYGAPIIISPDKMDKESKEIFELIGNYRQGI